NFPIDAEGTVSRIGSALDRGELSVDFQPVVSLRTGRLRGVEAHVRWQHPEQGLVGADEIISSVRGSAVASRLDDWVLRTAISMFADWCRKYSSARELVLAVNVGVERLSEPGLDEWLRAELERNELTPESLCVEIPDVWLTESSRAGDEVLGGLAALGVCIALDSSGAVSDELFDELKRHSITSVKLDRSLLRAATSDYGRNLEQLVNNALARDLTVIAEGVESESQLDLLRSFGSQLAQGYYFPKPLAVLAIEQQISVMETAEP
ncbi:MAG: EAL domain-containing protein, partial [Acidimicrobiales bacterium]